MVHDCQISARNRRFNQRQRKLNLFKPNSRSEFVAIDILCPFLKTGSGNQFAVVVTDCYSKLTKGALTSRRTAANVAVIFLNNWISSRVVLTKVLTGNNPQFESKFFKTNCVQQGIVPLTITEYHPQSIGHVEQFSTTIV